MGHRSKLLFRTVYLVYLFERFFVNYQRILAVLRALRAAYSSMRGDAYAQAIVDLVPTSAGSGCWFGYGLDFAPKRVGPRLALALWIMGWIATFHRRLCSRIPLPQVFWSGRGHCEPANSS